MSKENTDTTDSKGLSPFQQFVKEAATGPDTAPPDGEKTEEKPPVEEPPADTTPAPVADLEEINTIQDLVKRNQKADENLVDENAGETHEFFKDLKKPGKGATRGEQINYVKEVGRRWEQHAKELETKLQESESQTFDPTETDQWKDLSGKLEEYKKQAERTSELEQNLAAVDLQYDPTFIKTVTEPIQKEETSLIEVVKAAKGEDAAEIIPMMQAALAAENESDFLNGCKRVTDEVGGAFGLAAFDHLRKLRALNTQRNEYIANHQETSKRFLQERHAQNQAVGAKYIESDWKRHRTEAQKSIAGTWEFLQEKGFEELSKEATTTREAANSWAEESIKANIEHFGGMTDSVAQTMAVAPELLALVPLVNKSLEYIKTRNEEYDKLKEQYEALTKGSTPSLGRQSEQKQDEAPGGLVEFARQQGVI